MNVKHCARCGKSFDCGSDHEGNVCWCDELPPVKQVIAGEKCLCRDCLKEDIKAEINSFVEEFSAGKTKNIAPQYARQGKPLVEGIDYYTENNLWVFTGWYHLKRGYCCGSGCRHCPYPAKQADIPK